MIGSGPIVIGQACEFDYSGVQALKALKEEGIRTILINNNPATIMTDPDLVRRDLPSNRSSLGLWRPSSKRSSQDRRRLPTVGVARPPSTPRCFLHRDGILERYGCRLIGASAKAIRAAEDREAFRQILAKEGMETSRSFVARSVEEGYGSVARRGRLPRDPSPSCTLGGQGGGIARTLANSTRSWNTASLSPTHSVLVEESLIGWKEFELEVIRDRADNVVIICSIENLDPWASTREIP